MPSIIQGFEYDIFISYRQNDNKRDGWVTEFVNALRSELEATIKNPVSLYMDENAHDGLLETHQVDDSLEKKLRCIVFIPIISQTYCDTASFAWQHEFLMFLRTATQDSLGMKVTLANGNVVSRVLPIQIHELDQEDRQAIESALGGPLRAIPFIYQSAGVNRPLRANEDHPQDNKNHTYYRDQINKVANALKDIGTALVKHAMATEKGPASVSSGKVLSEVAMSTELVKQPLKKFALLAGFFALALVLIYYLFLLTGGTVGIETSQASVGVIPFRNNTGDQGMNHYGVGIASEVSTQLGLTKQFDFISSLQATIQYQQSDKTPADIGKELGVTHIVSGMYQTAGNNIQVLVELVEAASGKVIWSLPYRTKYDDIFEVQASIASKVMDKFEVVDLAKKRIPTQNVEAYAHFIRGFELIARSNLPADRQKALPEFKRAIELDSGFIGGWYGVIHTCGYAHFNRLDPNDSSLVTMVKPYMNYVRKHFPESWEKWIIEGNYAYWVEKDYDKGLEFFLKALNENPEAVTPLGAIYRRKLQLKESLTEGSKFVKRDPSPVAFNELRGLLELSGDYENAGKAALMMYQLNESLPRELYNASLRGNSLEDLPEKVKQVYGNTYRADLFIQKRDYKSLVAFLDSLSPDSNFQALDNSYYQARAKFGLGQEAAAKRHAAIFMKLRKENPTLVRFRMGFALNDVEMNSILGDEKAVLERDVSPWVNPDKDLQVQYYTKAGNVLYYAMNRQYLKADDLLREINRDYPQVGDYCWLDGPLFDRIKKEYPQFLETINQLKLPPKLTDTNLLRM